MQTNVMYQAVEFTGGVIQLKGSKTSIIRVTKEQIPNLPIQDTLKGLYVLWGGDEYYVGQGSIKNRLLTHFNNEDKYFTRAYILAFQGTHEDYMEFTHYLLDLEGALDHYLTNESLSSMNIATTLRQPLLPHFKGILDEWVGGLHIIDPTFRQPPIQQDTTQGIGVGVRDAVIEDLYAYDEEGYDLARVTDTTNLTDEQIKHLNRIPVGKAAAKTIDQIVLSNSLINEYCYKYKLIHKTMDDKYYQDPLVTVEYVNGGVKVVNHLGHITAMQVRDIQVAMDVTNVINGELIKKKGIPRKIYTLLTQLGYILEVRSTGVHYYLNDTLADQLLIISEESQNDIIHETGSCGSMEEDVLDEFLEDDTGGSDTLDEPKTINIGQLVGHKRGD